jgi:hypothetical protein
MSCDEEVKNPLQMVLVDQFDQELWCWERLKVSKQHLQDSATLSSTIIELAHY